MRRRLIVLLDGLGHTEISKDKTPFLYSFAKKNYFARLNTLLSFAGIEHSFFKGNLPDENKAFLEFVYSPETSCFKWQKYFKFFGRTVLSYITAFIQYISGREHLTGIFNMPFEQMQNFDVLSKKSIWGFEMLKNKNSVCYRWPFIVKNGKKKLKLKYESDRERCRTLIKSIEKNVEVYTVQLIGLDKIAHKYGKGSKEYNLKLRELDKDAKFIFDNFNKKIPNLEVIFWSDHDFINIKKGIDLINILPKSKDYIMFVGGTTISFWFKKEVIKKEVIKRLKKIKEGKILDKKDIKKYHIPLNSKNGEMIFVVKPGYYIFPNYYQGLHPYKAMHGYAPDEYDSDGILITNIKLKKKDYGINEVMHL